MSAKGMIQIIVQETTDGEIAINVSDSRPFAPAPSEVLRILGLASGIVAQKMKEWEDKPEKKSKILRPA